jgi:ABC-2 type transport system ATP-binding protein
MRDWTLRVVSGPAAGQMIAVDGDFTVGRAADGPGRLGNDPELSREHAMFSHDGSGRLLVQDRGSTNGTLVNGDRIHEIRVLQPGDRVEMGQTTLELEPRAREPADAGGASRPAVVTPGQATTMRPSLAADEPAADEPAPEPPVPVPVPDLTLGPEILTAVRGPAQGMRIEIGASIEFGREVAGAGMLEGDLELSRHHARITREVDGRLTLEDLGSTNGTYLNGWRIPSPQVLSDNDQISIGQSVLELTGVPASADREPSVIEGEQRGPGPKSSADVVLKVDSVTKSYGERQILKGLDLEIRAGEIVGLLGPNGAGKSTFASIVAGLQAATSGTVTINGIDVSKDLQRARRQLGMAPQDLGIYPTQTVYRNLEFFGEIAGLRGKLLKDRIQEVGDALSLTTMFARKAAILSGGQKRRLHCGMAMLHHPPLLIMDEPTVGADIRTRQEILDAVKALAAEGRAICYSTHYLPEIEEMGASVAILDDGRIVARGSIAELVAHHSSQAVELTFAGDAPEIDPEPSWEVTHEGSLVRIRCDDPSAVAATIVARLGGNAERLRSVEILSPSLDSVYLSLTERRYASAGEVTSGDVGVLPPPVAIPAGWYSDPAGGAGGTRYWDGQRWTDLVGGSNS